MASPRSRSGIDVRSDWRGWLLGSPVPFGRALGAQPEQLEFVIELDETVVCGHRPCPPFDTGCLDLFGAPARAADQMMMVLGVGALPIQHLARILANGVQIAAADHVLQRPVHGGQSGARPLGAQRGMQILRRDEAVGAVQDVQNLGPLRGVTALDSHPASPRSDLLPGYRPTLEHPPIAERADTGSVGYRSADGLAGYGTGRIRDTGRVRTPAERIRPAVMMAVAAVLALLAGCTAAPSADGPGTVTVGTVTHTRPPSATITRTVTGPDPSPGPADVPSGAAGNTGTTGTIGASGTAGMTGTPGIAGTPAMTGTPGMTGNPPRTGSARPPTFSGGEPVDGNCPYLKSSEVNLLAGQRVGRVQLIPARLQPICVFYRIVDGGWLGAVRVIEAGDPAQAVAAVDEAVPPADSSPADQPQGWGGGYQLLPDGAAEFSAARAVYGVSKGARAVIAWNSRNQTVKSRRLVEATITSLGW